MLAACGDDGTATTSAAGVTTTAAVPVVLIEITEADGVSIAVAGVPVESASRLNLELGVTVRIEATLAHADEIHVHGYDLAVDAAAGETAVLEFTADIPGVFEVEFEGSGELLFELAVS